MTLLIDVVQSEAEWIANGETEMCLDRSDAVRHSSQTGVNDEIYLIYIEWYRLDLRRPQNNLGTYYTSPVEWN